MTTAAPAPTGSRADVLALEDTEATNLVLALQRLAQQSTLYTSENEAQRRALDAVAKAASGYGQATGRNITIFFSDRAVYVGRRLLRATRAIYAAANQLREMFAIMGVSQITIARDASLDELSVLQAAFATAQRDPQNAQPPTNLSKVRLGVGRPPGDYAEFDGLTPEERAIKVYTLAVVIVRRFYDDLQCGSVEIPSQLRRISEQLITLAERADPAFLAVTAGRPAHDDASRAVASAMLAVSIGRKLTDDPRTLRNLATATMLCDVGKPRITNVDPTGGRRTGRRLPILAAHQYGELPGATAVTTTALGKMTDAGMTRSLLVFEMLHLLYHDETGAVYGGSRAPLLLARLMAQARRFQDELNKGTNAAAATAKLVRDARDDTDRAIVQLIMAALCVFPAGSVVELSSGELAQVIASAESSGSLGRPVIRTVPQNGDASASRFIDLSMPSEEQGDLRITRVVATVNDARAKEIAEQLEQMQHTGGDIPESERATPKPAKPLTPQSVVVPMQPLSRSLQQLANRDDDIYIMLGPKHDSGPHVELASIPAPPIAPVSDAPTGAFSDPPAAEMPSLRPTKPANAQGTLGKTPLVHLLVYTLDNRLSGTLLLENENRGKRGKCAIYFDTGTPSKVRTPALVCPLDRTLIRMGLLDADAVAASLRSVARSKRLHGQVLLEQGLIDERQLADALRQQMVDKVGHMLRFEPSSRYAYYANVDLLADYGAAELMPCEPLSLIMMGVRKYLDDAVILSTLARISSKKLELHPDAEPQRLGLRDMEQAVMIRLAAEPTSLDALRVSGSADKSTVERLIYALLITRCIDVSNGTRRPVGVQS